MKRWLAGTLLLFAAPSGPAPGTVVDIGTYKLHIYCVGPASAQPTVILEAGGGAFSSTWSAVQQLLAPRTMTKDVDDLHALLRAAKVQGPYVLVGHSLGGLLVRLYVERYSADVAGMVLVDPTHENTRLFFLRQGQRLRVREQDDEYMSAELQHLYDERRRRPRSLGNRPLAVVASSRADAAPPGTAAELWDQLLEEKRREKVSLTGLSTRSKLVGDPTSGHDIQRDNPSLVADTIATLVAAASNR